MQHHGRKGSGWSNVQAEETANGALILSQNGPSSDDVKDSGALGCVNFAINTNRGTSEPVTNLDTIVKAHLEGLGPGTVMRSPIEVASPYFSEKVGPQE